MDTAWAVDVRALGDIDGDGFADAAVSTVAGAVAIFGGGPDRPLSAGPVATLTEVVTTALAAGDVNGDGVPEIAVGCAACDPYASVYLVQAPLTGVVDVRASPRVYGLDRDGFGRSIAVGDVNADGIGDLLVGAPNTDDATGAAYLLYGGGPIGLRTRSGTAVVSAGVWGRTPDPRRPPRRRRAPALRRLATGGAAVAGHLARSARCR